MQTALPDLKADAPSPIERSILSNVFHGKLGLILHKKLY